MNTAAKSAVISLKKFKASAHPTKRNVRCAKENWSGSSPLQLYSSRDRDFIQPTTPRVARKARQNPRIRATTRTSQQPPLPMAEAHRNRRRAPDLRRRILLPKANEEGRGKIPCPSFVQQIFVTGELRRDLFPACFCGRNSHTLRAAAKVGMTRVSATG
jgi:hypothetical protein